jgi:hypothetical protein
LTFVILQLAALHLTAPVHFNSVAGLIACII